MGVSKVFQFPSEDFCSREENEIAPPPTNVYASLASLQLVKRSSSDVTWNTDGIYAAAHHRNYSYSFAKHLPDRRSSTWGIHNRVSARSGRVNCRWRCRGFIAGRAAFSVPGRRPVAGSASKKRFR
jgi:hypothetical protein